LRYPNRRYGNPVEFEYYALRYGSGAAGIKEVAKCLRRSERSVKDWMTGKKKVPWWVPEILRLKAMEHWDQVYQMTGRRMSASMGFVAPTGQVINAAQRFLPVDPLPAPAPTEALRRCK
jgi:hypothetical protein